MNVQFLVKRINHLLNHVIFVALYGVFVFAVAALRALDNGADSTTYLLFGVSAAYILTAALYSIKKRALSVVAITLSIILLFMTLNPFFFLSAWTDGVSIFALILTTGPIVLIFGILKAWRLF